MSSRPSTPVISIAIALVLVAAGAAYYFLRPTPSADVRKFTGVLKAVEGNVVTLYGTFYPLPEQVPERFRSGRDFAFRADGSTKVFSISLSRPPSEKVLANGGGYLLKLNELPRKEEPGSLDELKTLIDKGNVYVEVSFPSSILTARNPVASSVVYRYLPRPDFSKL